MKRFDGMLAVVSGGARGQGREIARRLAEDGADIATFDLCEAPKTSQYIGATTEDLMETAAIVESMNKQCRTRILDVRDHAAVTAFVDDTVDEFGKVDIVCANAGLATWVPFLEMRPDHWDEVMDINAGGVFNTMQATLRHMAERRSGVAVLTASVTGLEAVEGMSHYVASKHAVVGLTKNLALEFGSHGIRVNCILPSTVNTRMGNNPRNMRWIFGRDDATEEEYLDATRQWHVLRNCPAIEPSAIADVAAWLCSHEARYITGSAVPIDGGHLILPGFNHNPVKE